MMFPALTNQNLLDETCVLPDEFAGNFNILYITSEARQLFQIARWLPFIAELNSESTPLETYIFPIIPKAHLMARRHINNGMKPEMPEWVNLHCCVPLYVIRPTFYEQVGITEPTELNILLVDKIGQILWQTSAAPTPKLLDEIRQTIQNHT
jgi:hypothetical protein